MPDSFFKLYNNIFTGTFRDVNHATFRVWIACISLADESGYFNATPEYIKLYANVTDDERTLALDYLMAPDPTSTSAHEDGRRLLQVSPNRWLVVNKAAYREKSSADDRRTAQRELMRRRRAAERTAKELANNTGENQIQSQDGSTDVSRGVSNVSPKRKEKREKEIKTDGFSIFQNAYPKRNDGAYDWQAAREIFEELCAKGFSHQGESFKSEAASELITDGTKRYAAACAANPTKAKGQYIKKPAKFLADHSFLDPHTTSEGSAVPKKDIDYWLQLVHYVEGDERDPEETTMAERHSPGFRVGNIPMLMIAGERKKERFDPLEWLRENGYPEKPLRFEGTRFLAK